MADPTENRLMKEAAACAYLGGMSRPHHNTALTGLSFNERGIQMLNLLY
jgi:hypothetical protein